jgi:hypothetical protein
MSDIIYAYEIKQLMQDAGFIDRRIKPMWLILDQAFILPHDEEVWEIIGKDDTDRLNFVPNIGDCDNFAFELRRAFERKGLAVGVIVALPDDGSEKHAIFFYINKGHEIKTVEPQTDEYYNKSFKLLAVIMY